MENRALYFSFISNAFVKNKGIIGLSSFYVNLFELKRCKLINMNFGALVVKF